MPIDWTTPRERNSRTIAMALGWLFWWVISSIACSAAERLVLENEFLRVEFSSRDGSLARVRNKPRGLELIARPVEAPQPFALLLAPLEFVTEYSAFRALPDADAAGRRVRFEWDAPHGITVAAQAELLPGSDRLLLQCSARNAGERTILALRYPNLQGIGPLSAGGERDRLLHSAAMGLVFRNPFDLFRADHPILAGRGLVVSRYPNGFHGSALQLVAYYAQGQGGFSIATEDGRATDKDFNFYKASGDALTCEVAHFNWDARPGQSLELEYPTVITALTRGDWYEAAERYRDWAQQQSWCRRGTLHERVERGDAARWLLEEIGAVGMWWPFRTDIRGEIARTRELFGAPLLHLELWWQHGDSLAAAQRDGDRFGPFYFPYLALQGRSTFAAHERDAVQPRASVIAPEWVVMCAGQQRWRETFCQSAEDMAGAGPARHQQIWMDGNGTGCNADCLYYDIGPCAGIPTHCYAADHDHVPGAGRQMTAAHVALLEDSQRRAGQIKGAYVPIGTECASEPFVGCLDLYYPRNAGYGPDMELAPYVRQLTWLPDGQMEVVPLLPFVYHEYGPLAVQGVHAVDPWTERAGDEFHAWAEARAFLWGGVTTAFPLREDVEPPPRRVQLVRSLVAARTGFARDYLVYGRMGRPPALRCGTTQLDHGLAAGGWLRNLRFDVAGKVAGPVAFHVPDGAGAGGEQQEPAAPDAAELSVEKWVAAMLAIGATPAQNKTVEVPSVACSVYTFGPDRIGVLLVNVSARDEEAIEIVVEPAQFGLAAGEFEFRRRTVAADVSLGTQSRPQPLGLTLAPWEVVLLEAVRRDHPRP